MKNIYNNSEDRLKDSILQHEFPFDPNAWENMEALLSGVAPDKPKAAPPGWRVFRFVPFFALGITAVGIFLWNGHSESENSTIMLGVDQQTTQNRNILNSQNDENHQKTATVNSLSEGNDEVVKLKPSINSSEATHLSGYKPAPVKKATPGKLSAPLKKANTGKSQSPVDQPAVHPDTTTANITEPVAVLDNNTGASDKKAEVANNKSGLSQAIKQITSLAALQDNVLAEGTAYSESFDYAYGNPTLKHRPQRRPVRFGIVAGLSQKLMQESPVMKSDIENDHTSILLTNSNAFIPGFQAGLAVSIPLASKVDLNAELVYKYKRGMNSISNTSHNEIVSFPANPNPWELLFTKSVDTYKASNINALHTIELPVSIAYTAWKRHELSAGVRGAYILSTEGRSMSDQITTTVVTQIDNSSIQDIQYSNDHHLITGDGTSPSLLNRFNYGLMLGYGYKFNSATTLKLKFNYALNNFTNPNYSNNNQNITDIELNLHFML